MVVHCQDPASISSIANRPTIIELTADGSSKSTYSLALTQFEGFDFILAASLAGEASYASLEMKSPATTAVNISLRRSGRNYSLIIAYGTLSCRVEIDEDAVTNYCVIYVERYEQCLMLSIQGEHIACFPLFFLEKADLEIIFEAVVKEYVTSSGYDRSEVVVTIQELHIHGDTQVIYEESENIDRF